MYVHTYYNYTKVQQIIYLCPLKQANSHQSMKINLEKTNRIISVLIILVIAAGAISAIFLNEAQRIIVGIGVVLGVLNLLGMRYFFNKNNRPPSRR